MLAGTVSVPVMLQPRNAPLPMVRTLAGTV